MYIYICTYRPKISSKKVAASLRCFQDTGFGRQLSAPVSGQGHWDRWHHFRPVGVPKALGSRTEPLASAIVFGGGFLEE